MVESYSATTEDLDIELGLGVDMADIFEVRGYPRTVRGTLCPIELFDDKVVFGYDGLDGRRRTTTVTLAGDRLEPVDDPEIWPGASVVARWTAKLAPGKRLAIGWTVGDETVDIAPAATKGRRGGPGPRPELEPRFEVPHIRSDHELLDRTLARSVVDLAALHNDGPGPGEQYMAAGIPWFATLFGRDSLIAALETVAFIPTLAVATLEVLARLQATTDDPWHDAEPGKILHELRTGEMALAGETPHDAYYGSVDSTPLWLILLGETYAWTGDDALLERLWPHALAALEWIERSGDLDGDGFVEYERRSRLGLLNQGWKDSGDSIRHADGRPAEGPIALVEVQGYAYAARRSMARLARRRNETELAARLEVDAEALMTRFDEAFWMPEERFYAIALDGEKRQVGSIASNAGQALWTGIVPAERAARVTERLLETDMFSGWGVRTFASGQPGYNPVGYHTGSIWPHDNALIAAGLKANGAADGANLMAGPAHRGGPVVPGPAAARAVLRVRSDRGRGAGGVSGRLLAAGLVGRGTVLAAQHDARAAGRRERPPARAHPPDPAGLADEADHHGPPGRRRLGRSAGPSLARPDERGAPRAARDDRRHHPRLSRTWRESWPTRRARPAASWSAAPAGWPSILTWLTCASAWPSREARWPRLVRRRQRR